jgi:hypothetical protein
MSRCEYYRANFCSGAKTRRQLERCIYQADRERLVEKEMRKSLQVPQKLQPPAPTTTCVPHPTLDGYQVCGQTPLGQGNDTGARPQNPSATDRQPRSAKPLFLTIKSDLTLMLGNDPVARDALGSLFDAATGGDKDTPIYLRADRRVPYGEVMRIMELLRAAGYAKLLLVGHESESQPSASIVIEFAPVPLAPVPFAPGTIPPWNWTAERAAAESAAAEWGRAGAEVAAREKSPVLTWKSQIVARLEEHKQYPEEAQSRREQRH